VSGAAGKEEAGPGPELGMGATGAKDTAPLPEPKTEVGPTFLQLALWRASLVSWRCALGAAIEEEYSARQRHAEEAGEAGRRGGQGKPAVYPSLPRGQGQGRAAVYPRLPLGMPVGKTVQSTGLQGKQGRRGAGEASGVPASAPGPGAGEGSGVPTAALGNASGEDSAKHRLAGEAGAEGGQGKPAVYQRLPVLRREGT